mgnify:CR=1 FL=1
MTKTLCMNKCLLALCMLGAIGLHPLLPLQSLAATPTSPAASSDSPSEGALIKSMKDRLPALMALKLDGAVGETNKGLIEPRGALEREQRRLVADENKDRLAHYKLIAEKLGLPVAAVQRKRAEQIREKSPKGVMLESETGIWYEK